MSEIPENTEEELEQEQDVPELVGQIDEIIHSRIRLGIMILLYEGNEVEFTYLKTKLSVSDGNLSVHMKKLIESGYVKARKKFIGNKPNTSYGISKKGEQAMLEYLKIMKELLQ